MTGFEPRTSGTLLLNTEKRKNPFFHLRFSDEIQFDRSASLSSKPNLENDIQLPNYILQETSRNSIRSAEILERSKVYKSTFKNVRSTTNW